MRYLLIMICLLPAAWPASALAGQCDPIGKCREGNTRTAGHGVPTEFVLAMGADTLKGQGSERGSLGKVAAQWLSLPGNTGRPHAGIVTAQMPSSGAPAKYRNTAGPGDDGAFKERTASASLGADQPGNGALLIAGFLGMVAVARRRISSIL